MSEFVNSAIYPLGDHALIVRVSDVATPRSVTMVNQLFLSLERNPPTSLIELVPAHHSLAIYFDPLIQSYEAWHERLLGLLSKLQVAEDIVGKTIVIPVCYGGQYGPDILEVAELAGLSEVEVIRLHSGSEYRVGMIGFVPGFPYLLGLSERLVTSRRQTPRTVVPEGSVGIGGTQTGIYPSDIPGGWQIIGRTPIRMFQAKEYPPCILSPGDSVRFEPIHAREFAKLERDRQ